MRKVLAKKAEAKKIAPKPKNIMKENIIQPKNENPVYFKLGYHESLEARRNLLLSEISFLNIMKIMKRYNSLRMEELKIKSEMYKAIRDLDFLAKKTKSSFPFLKIPETARRKQIREIESPKEIKPIKEENFENDLESQLRNIQDKLKAMGR